MGMLLSSLLIEGMFPLQWLFHLPIWISACIGGAFIGTGVGLMMRYNTCVGGLDLLAPWCPNGFDSIRVFSWLSWMRSLLQQAWFSWRIPICCFHLSPSWSQELSQHFWLHINRSICFYHKKPHHMLNDVMGFLSFVTGVLQPVSFLFRMDQSGKNRSLIALKQILKFQGGWLPLFLLHALDIQPKTSWSQQHWSRGRSTFSVPDIQAEMMMVLACWNK